MTPSPDLEHTSTQAIAAPEQHSEREFREIMELFFRRKFVLFASFLLVVAVGAIYTFTRHKVYESSTLVLAASQSGSKSSGDAMLDSLVALTENQDVNTQVEVLNSPQVINAAYTSLSAAEREKGFQVDDVTNIPPWSYQIAATTGTSAISITTRAYAPDIAAKFANAIANTYLDQDLKQSNAATHNARLFVERELGKLQNQLSTATAQLANFQKTSNMVSPEAQITTAATEIAKLRDDRDNAESALSTSELRLKNLEAQMKSIDKDVQAGTQVEENPEYAQVSAQLGELRNSLAAASQEFAPDSQRVRKIKDQIQALESRRRTLAQTVITAVNRQRNPLLDQLLTDYAKTLADRDGNREQLAFANRVFSERQLEFEKYPEQKRTFAEQSRRVDELARTDSLLSDRYWTLLIAERSGIPHGVIASSALPALKPSYPKVATNLIASILVAIMLSICTVLLVERLDTRLHDPAAASRVTGLTMLAAIPETKSTDPSGQLLIGKVEQNYGFLEAFRLLRNNISFSSPDRNLRVLAVTSAAKSEGKTTVAVNLALAMIMDGKRVLLIDADLRRPAIHTVLGLSRDVGFTSVVKNLVSLEKAVVETEMEGLSVLTSGPLPPNTTEFLNSQQARNVFEHAADMYDMVIIDSPPSTGLSDFQVISTIADGVLLVIALDSTVKQQMEATVRMLSLAHAPMIGAVLNRVQYHRGANGYYSSYYSSYYSYYGEDIPDEKRKKTKRKKSGGSSA